MWSLTRIIRIFTPYSRTTTDERASWREEPAPRSAIVKTWGPSRPKSAIPLPKTSPATDSDHTL